MEIIEDRVHLNPNLIELKGNSESLFDEEKEAGPCRSYPESMRTIEIRASFSLSIPRGGRVSISTCWFQFS
jgi:hypothetical protein